MSDAHTQPEQERRSGAEQTKEALQGRDNAQEQLEDTGVRNVVSEITSETAGEEGAGASTQSAAQTASHAQRIAFEEHKKQLLAAKPPAENMVRDINATLAKEKKELRTQEKKYRSSGDLNNLGKIVARLREINEVFALIAHITYDILKKIWLKVVHGIV